MCSDTDASELPATIPPPGTDPDKAWRVALMKEMEELRKEVKELTKLVKQLNRVTQDCFRQMLDNERETRDLRIRVETVEARLTIRPPRKPDAE